MSIRRGLVYKIRKSLRKRGLTGTAGECVRVAPACFRRFTPAGRRFKAEQERYDAEHGIRTEQLIFLDDMDIPGPHVPFGGAYQATAAGDLESVLREIAIRHSEYTFIDLGSGLGRPLFVAAEYPFRRIIGVEFAPDLHALAAHNLACYRSPSQQCRRIELLRMDAADYRFPPEKTLLYLFNPFTQPVMKIVLANLEQSLLDSPRHVMVLYRLPTHKGVFDRAAFLHPVPAKPHWAIYETDA